MNTNLVPQRTYYLVFLALLVLTVLTVAATFVELGPLHLAVGLAIATTKALLVILFFMHLLYANRLLALVFASGFFWLVILLALTLSDYLTRQWL